MAKAINEYQASSGFSGTTTTSSLQLLAARSGNLIRTQLIITNTHGTAVLTLFKGESGAVAGAGILLQPLQTYIEASDGGYNCWQGALQGVSNINGSYAGMESFEELSK